LEGLGIELAVWRIHRRVGRSGVVCQRGDCRC
jgi:hypothetical protein